MIENQFENHFLIMIDVLRASTTICTALKNGAKEVIPFDEPQKAVAVYANLSKESRFLGGEKNSIKPEGFDAGNSPSDYNQDVVEGKSIIFSTTNGTRTFVKGKKSRKGIIGCFSNLSVVSELISSYIRIDKEEGKDTNLTILCSGTDGRISYEDTVCAGAFISQFTEYEPEITDSALLAKNIYWQHKDNLAEFLSGTFHARRLLALGLQEDLDTCFTFDKNPVVPVFVDSSIILEK